MDLVDVLSGPPRIREDVHWEGRFLVEKFLSDDLDAIGYGLARPYDVVEGKNLLLTAGASAYHSRLIGTSPTVFDATNARIAVGNGAGAAAAGQTNLLGSSTLRKVVDAAPVISGNTISFVATFGSGDANFSWEEAGIVNAASGGVLLNRVVQSFGAKSSGMTWVITGTIALT